MEHGGLMVMPRTVEQMVRGSIVTQSAIFCP